MTAASSRIGPVARRIGAALAGAAIAVCAIAPAAAADAFPARPVRFVVPFAPGGSTDTLARTLSLKLADAFGHQVVVDNRPGANGDIGMQIVANAPADGHTIVLGYIANLGIGPSLNAKMPYDPVKDFAPITQLANAPNILVVHPSVPAKTFKAFVAYVKANPRKVNFASASVASVGHLTGELINGLAGIDMVHVPYKGSGQAVIDLIGGQVQAMFSGMSSTLPQVRTGKLRALAVTGAKRSPAAPDVPTIAESGFPGFEATAWYGVLTAARTPKPAVNRLHAEIVKALALPDVRQRLEGVGFEIVGGTPDEFAAYIRSEIAKWAKVVKAAGVKPE